jgi:hypothetical protein
MKTIIKVGIAIVIIIVIWLFLKSKSNSEEKFTVTGPLTKINLENTTYTTDIYVFENNNNMGYLKNPVSNLYATNENGIIQFRSFTGAANQTWSYRPNNQGKLAGQNGKYLYSNRNGSLGVRTAQKNELSPGINWAIPKARGNYPEYINNIPSGGQTVLANGSILGKFSDGTVYMS